LRFEVRDTGIGMTPEQVARIFEPFIQADVSTTRKYGGTGLGMAITKNIIDLMGGSLEIESAPGAGTVIGFELTLETSETAVKISEMGNPVNELDKPTFDGEVLVCEDNQMNQRVIIDHLSRVGLKIEIAGNGQEGIDKVQARIDTGKKPFDLILMDIHMPVMDGLTATKKILGMGAGTPIVAMTANIMTDDRELYQAAGMLDYVGKPFTSQALWRCLLKYLTPVNFTGADEYENKGADTAIQKQLKTDFVAGNRDKFNEIAGALDNNDIALAYRLVHTLKSNAGLIGKTALQNAAASIEAALKGGENRAAERQMDVLCIELRSALDELGPYLNETAVRTGADTIAMLDADTARKLLEELEPMLKSGNPECLKMADDIRSVTGSAELIRQMEDYEFYAAADELAKLKLLFN